MSGSRYIGMRAITVVFVSGGVRLLGSAAAVPAAVAFSSFACGCGRARLLQPSRLSHTHTAGHSSVSSAHTHSSLLSALRSAVEERKETEDDEQEDDDVSALAVIDAGRTQERRGKRVVTLSAPTEDDRHCPVYSRLVSLSAAGDVNGMLRVFRSFQLTARLGSWHLMLWTLGSKQRVDDMAALWQQWQSNLPQPASSDAASTSSTARCLPTLETYRLVLSCRGFPLTAVDALLQLQARGLSGDTFIYNRCVKEHLQARKWWKAAATLQAMRQAAVQPDVFTFSLRFTLLDLRHGQNSDVLYREAASLWDEMLGCRLRPPASLTAAFAFVFCEQRDVERVVQAVEALRDWGRSRCRPNTVCLQLMMSCLMRADRLPELLRLYGYSRFIGEQPQVLTFYTLINAFSRHGDTASMALLYQEMLAEGVQPNIRVFHSLLQGHARAGDREGTDAMLQRMAELGVEPDAEAFLCILQGVKTRFLTQILTWRDARQQDTREARAKAGDPVVAPLSAQLLPYLTMMDERSLTPLLDSYLLLLSALRHEQDFGSMLRCLHHMASRGVAPDAVSLEYAVMHLSMRPWSVHESLQARQLELLLERVEQPLSLSQDGWAALLLIYRKEQSTVGMEAAYSRMKAAPPAVWITAEALVELMADCFACSDPAVRQHERMRFIRCLYADLLQTGDQQRLTARVFDMALEASAVLGDAEAIKEVLRRMQAAGVAIGESTAAVLEAARQHVLFSAEMVDWLQREKSRVQTASRQQSLRDGIERERQRGKKPDAQTEAGQAQAAGTDAAALVRELLVLPAWSPLSAVLQAQQAALQSSLTAPSEAASEELQTAIAARLSSLPLPVLYASEFPTIVAAHAVAPVQAGPGQVELAAIVQEQKRLEDSWPRTSTDQRADQSAPAAIATAEQSAPEAGSHSPASARTGARRGRAGSVRLQAIDEEPLRTSLLFSSSPASAAESDIPQPVRLDVKDEEADGEVSGAALNPAARAASSSSFRPVMRLTSESSMGRMKPFGCRPVPQQPSSSSSSSSSAVGRRPVHPSSPRAGAASPLLHITRLLSASRGSLLAQSTSTRAASGGQSRREEEEGKLQTQRKGYQ